MLKPFVINIEMWEDVRTFYKEESEGKKFDPSLKVKTSKLRAFAEQRNG